MDLFPSTSAPYRSTWAFVICLTPLFPSECVSVGSDSEQALQTINSKQAQELALQSSARLHASFHCHAWRLLFPTLPREAFAAQEDRLWILEELLTRDQLPHVPMNLGAPLPERAAMLISGRVHKYCSRRGCIISQGRGWRTMFTNSRGISQVTVWPT